MALLNDLGKKINDVGQMTKDMAGIAKYNSMISDEENKAKALYEKIGRKYVADLAKDEGGELGEWIAQVKACEEKILSYNETVRSLKGIAICPECGAQVNAENVFCSVCGAKMPKIEKPDDKSICPHCGTAVPKDSKFCFACGQMIETGNE